MIINQELKSLIPPLTADEFNQLENNIILDGCRDPIVVWGETIIDGHNRYAICTKHNLPYKTVSKDFESIAAVRIWMRNNQFGRRNLTDGWRIELALGNKADLLEIGRAKLKEIGELSSGLVGVPALSSDDKPAINTRETLAKAAQVSTGKLAQAEIVRRESPEVWERVKDGDGTVGEAYKEIKKEEKKQTHFENVQKQKQEIAQGNLTLPTGLFDVIAIDPPWNYGREYDPDTSRVANPYPEMTQSELLQIELPAKDDCVLFLWTTHQFIFDAKELMDHWGFNYKATMVWNKQKIGMGAWVRMQCEFCLIGIKGKPIWENTTYRDIIEESRREHSRKPDAFYSMAADITFGRRLEYFAREAHQGWEIFGNDTEKF